MIDSARNWTAGVLAALAFVPVARAQSFGPQGAEFHVNSYTSEAQTAPSVAITSDGGFVVVWESRGQDGAGYGIFGQRFDAAGSPTGGEFQVNAHTTSDQRFPAVAADGAGRFIVVWESNQQDGFSVGVFGQRYDAATGALVGGVFQANSFTTSGQEHPVVAADSAGGFVVVWQSQNQDGSILGIFGQRYDSAGNPQGAEFRANTYTTSGQFEPSVAATGVGQFVVVWQSFGQDGSERGIFGQRFNSIGPVGPEFRVNTYTTGRQYLPAVASDASGRFTVAWQGYRQDGSQDDVFAQRYDAVGAAQGLEFRVNTLTTASQSKPAISADGAGNFVVVWQSLVADTSSWGVAARRFDAAGVAFGNDFVVNSYTTQYQGVPAVAADGAGRFVVVWQSFYQEGTVALSNGIYGQRLGPDDLIFADGFE